VTMADYVIVLWIREGYTNRWWQLCRSAI